MAHDRRKRSLLKMASYRIAVAALLAVITYYFTGNAGETGIITLTFNGGGAILYYGYERLWDSINWGKT